MIEKIYIERKKSFLVLAIFFLIPSFFVYPNVYTVPCGSWCVEPDSLVYLLTFLHSGTLLFILLYLLYTKKYKIIGKKYLLEGVEEEAKRENEIWKEVKE